MKNIIIILFLFFFQKVFTQPFYYESYRNTNVNASTQFLFIKGFSDSSLLSVQKYALYDEDLNTFKNHSFILTKHKKNGEYIFSKTISAFNDSVQIYIRDVTIYKDLIYIVGEEINIISSNSKSVILVLNSCFEITAYKLFTYNEGEYQSSHFTDIYINHNKIYATLKYPVPSDNQIFSLICMDLNLKINWISSFKANAIVYTKLKDKLFLWGYIYYHDGINNLDVSKLTYIFMDTMGNVLSQYVDNKDDDNFVSGHGGPLTEETENHILCFYVSKYNNVNNIELRKLNKNGDIIKSVRFNSSNELEPVYDIIKINNNKYLITGSKYQKDGFDDSSVVFMIDSNLNILHRKMFFKNYRSSLLHSGVVTSNNNIILGGRQVKKNTDFIFKSVIFCIDTNLNIVNKPSILGFTDSLCTNFDNIEKLHFPKADTVLMTEAMFYEKYYNVKVQNISKNTLTFNLYPNPNQGSFDVYLSKPFTGSLQVLDLTGKIVFEQKIINEEIINIELYNIKKGLYLVRIFNEEQNSNKKVVVGEN